MKKILWLVVLCSLFVGGLMAEQNYDLHTILMNDTYKIVGENNIIGTAFILGKPLKQDSLTLRYILVTAKHVLKDMKGDSATLILRRKLKNGGYEKVNWKIPIRRKGNPLWVEHENADVAVLKISLPRFIKDMIMLLPTTMLASDKDYKSLDIRTGDFLYCLGFPLNHDSNKYGFPVARQGILASYPVYPPKEIGYFLIDLKVFQGNSGGPVYLVSKNRRLGGGIYMGVYQKIVGLISAEKIHPVKHIDAYKQVEENIQLDLAVVVPSVFILETINKLD